MVPPHPEVISSARFGLFSFACRAFLPKQTQQGNANDDRIQEEGDCRHVLRGAHGELEGTSCSSTGLIGRNTHERWLSETECLFADKVYRKEEK